MALRTRVPGGTRIPRVGTRQEILSQWRAAGRPHSLQLYTDWIMSGKIETLDRYARRYPTIEAVRETEVTPIGVAKVIWRQLTPWEEEKGITAGDYFTGYYLRTAGAQQAFYATPEGQRQLAAIYGAERKAPLWAQAMFGQTVAKRDHTYYPVVVTMPPPITPARGVITAVRPVVRNFPTKVDWNKITTAIRNGQIKNADELALYVRRLKASRVAAGEPPLPTRAAPPSPQELQQIIKATNAANLTKTTVGAVPYLRFKPGQLTPERMQQLIIDWQQLKPTEATSQIADSGVVTIAMASFPEDIINIVKKASPASQKALFLQLDDELKKAVQERDTTKVREQAVEQTKHVIALGRATLVANEAADDAIDKKKGKDKAREDAENAVENLAKSTTDTGTKEVILTATEEIVTNAVETATGEKPALPKGAAIQRPPEQRGRGRAPTRLLPPAGGTDAEKRRRIRKARWAVGFRMGRLKAGDVWRTYIPVEADIQVIVVVGRAPKGATIATGAGSAFRTIKRLRRGKLPETFMDDIGAFRAVISPGKTKPNITFTPHVKISARSIPRITKAVPRIS